MAPSRRFRRRRRRGFLPFRSFFFQALPLGRRRRRRRPLSRQHLARHRQAQSAAVALGTKLLQAEHSMEITGPRSRRSRASNGGGSRSSATGAPDLLSDLPDCLLHNVMSFMKARQVVQTCVLSKRWRHLWRSVPCLNVDLGEFKTKTVAAPVCSYDDKAMNWDVDEFKTEAASPGCSCDRAMNSKEWGKFVDFTVNMVQQRCNIAVLDSLRLHGHGDRTPLLFLRYATRFSIQKERLSMSIAAAASSWRRLRRLQLTHVPLDHSFATHVGSGCHPLEDLELDGCTFEIPRVFFDSLKSLFLKDCGLGKLSEIAACHTLKTLAIFGGLNDPLVIVAPAVTYLHLAVKLDGFAAGISVKEMPSLDKAMIQLFCYTYCVPNCTDFSGYRFKFLHSVSNVTSLELCSVGGKVLGKEPTSKEFQNLKNLLLSHCDLSDDCILEFFLWRSPNLEKLTLRHCKLSDDTEELVLIPKTTDLLREDLKIEILYKERYSRQLIEFIKRVSGYRPENFIKLFFHVDLKCTP